VKNATAHEILVHETPLSNFIPYSHHVTENIISTKNAEYLSVWKIGGRSHQSASEADVFNWVRDLNNLLRGIATEHIALWSHVIRRRVFEYPDGEFENIFCKKIDEKYRQSFTGYNLMVNDLYLTVIFRPVVDKVLSFFAKGERQSIEQKKINQDKCIKLLEDINRTIGQSLKYYDTELLGIYEKHGFTFSSALEFLGLLINGESHPVPVFRNRFCNYLADNRPFFSKWGEVGEIRTTNSMRSFGMLEIVEFPDKTEPGHLNGLLESNYEFVLTQSFSALSKHAALGFLKKHQQQLLDAKDVAYTQIEEIDEAMDQLISGAFVMGEHHGTLTIFGDSAEQVRDYLAAAKSTLLDVSIKSSAVDLALEAGYWAQMPAVWAYRPRPQTITSLNFLSFSSFHNFLSGKPSGNPWGPAISIFKTISGTPLYFNFHATLPDDDATDKRVLGNTMLIGKSGTGKTVLLLFLLAQMQKLKPTVIVFDKDRGMDVAIRAMGGRYLPLKNAEPSGFNPFQLEPTTENLLFLKLFLKRLVMSDSSAVTHNDEMEIDQALKTLMTHMEKPSRRLSILLQSLPDPVRDELHPRPSVHSRLLKWCQGGDYGWLFDNATDALDLTTHQLYGFDVTDFLENQEIRPALMMYLLYRTEGMIDGRRFVYMFDEFQKPLEDEYFQDLTKNKQRVIRKQNGIFVFATQEPGAVLESPIAKTLVQQCATFIFLPNPGADYDEYTEGFKLTDAEFSLVKNLGENSRRFLVKQGDSSAVAELNLSGFDDELIVLSGTPDNAEIAEQVISEVGDNPNIWLPIYLQRTRSKYEKKDEKINDPMSHDFFCECHLCE
jgi:type IV secretion system protein VirB4